MDSFREHPRARRAAEHGEGGWSKINHYLEARVFHNKERGVFHVETTWGLDARALDAVGTAGRDSGRIDGRIKPTRRADHRLVEDRPFSADIHDHTRVSLTFEVPPGHYDITLADVHKRGGYWFPHDGEPRNRHSDIDVEHHTLEVTVGA